MRNALIQTVEKQYQRENALEFAVGDTVRVTIKIIEGNKERLQNFEGTVIGRKGRALDEMFTVRRLVGDEGVERAFPVHSPKIVAIKVIRHGKIRRGKLYYLRARVGKARKLRERRISAEARKAAQEARAAKARTIREAEEASRAAQQRERSGATEMAAAQS